MELKVLKGGKSSSLITEYRFAGGEITDTRLMGVVGMHLHWILPYETESRDLHQFYYYDIEELGLESMAVYIGDDEITVEMTGKSLYGGLGAAMRPLSEREARWLANTMIAETKRRNQLLPEEARDLDFITKAPVLLSEEEKDALERKMCVPIHTDYGAINYYLMRCFGKDPEGAALLVAENADPTAFGRIEPPRHSTFLRNSIQFTGGVIRKTYLCESLIEMNGNYEIVVTHVTVRNLRIAGARRCSSFPISHAEAALILKKDEYFTIYEVFLSEEDMEENIDEFTLGFHATMSEYENGRLFMIFRRTNDHVDSRVFQLSNDVRGMLFLTDHRQLLLCAYQLPELRQLEKTIRSSVLAPYLVPGRTIHSSKPVLYDFMHSDYDHFEDYLSSLTRRD